MLHGPHRYYIFVLVLTHNKHQSIKIEHTQNQKGVTKIDDAASP